MRSSGPAGWTGRCVAVLNDQLYHTDGGRPQNDFISWLIDDAEGAERTAPAIALRILATNTAAIHTSSSVHTYFLLR